ncbi:unnamed protein product [Rangifer tarandus platyrhynchus]|uniref:Uncharacterized protein n=2 Tax=Rangifer tarandus platyrhynchus TaxID=3082113 RepID=A0ABN8ZQQ5_RANTA|nr:unnamed protein product [Rangifer tarandus platyrhynchus]CAI9710044.1 unnamed protein product [Rangifer tarandus platyrhynchus]
MCAKLAARQRLQEGGGRRMNCAHAGLHAEPQMRSWRSRAEVTPQRTLNISPSVSAFLGRLPRATEEVCAIRSGVQLCGSDLGPLVHPCGPAAGWAGALIHSSWLADQWVQDPLLQLLRLAPREASIRRQLNPGFST